MIPRIPTSSREKRPREGPAPPEIDIGGLNHGENGGSDTLQMVPKK